MSTLNRKKSSTVYGRSPAAIRKVREDLDKDIRAAFSDFIDDCRETIEAEKIKEEMDDDLRTVARYMAKKAPAGGRQFDDK